MLKKIILASFAILMASVPAFAHPGPLGHDSLIAGLMHPITGLDHILAMLAVGVWAAQQGGRSMWALPLAFVGTMLVGGALGMSGVALPFVEPGILASIVVLGLMAALAVRLPLVASVALVSVFALVHGHAHGSELAGSSALLYATGFAVATMCLHLIGIAGAILSARVIAPKFIRVIGAVTAMLGLGMALAG